MRRFLREGKRSRVIGAFALLGFVIAGVCYMEDILRDYTQPMTWLRMAGFLLSLLLCPPQLPFIFCIDCEVVGWSGLVMYTFIGGLNAGLYALIGVLLTSRRPETREAGVTPTH